MNLYLLIFFFLFFFALLVIHAKRLITVSIALASVSALTATILYLAGAIQAAVIELSVGAGLVAVLFAFTNSLLAERNDKFPVAIPRLFALLLTLIVFGILILNSFGLTPSDIQTSNATNYFWEERGADLVAQMALMFSTVLAVLGLLTEHESPVSSMKAAKEEA